MILKNETRGPKASKPGRVKHVCQPPQPITIRPEPPPVPKAFGKKIDPEMWDLHMKRIRHRQPPYREYPDGIQTGDLWLCPECKAIWRAMGFHSHFSGPWKRVEGFLNNLRLRKRFRRERKQG